jgi:predicted nucleotidyltransferase
VRRHCGDGWIEVAKRRREVAEALAEFIQRCVGDVALFGSRTRDDFHDTGHWDLAAVTQDGVETEKFGQVVYIPLSKLHQLLAFSMLILDVAYEGRPLCGVLAGIRQGGDAVGQGEEAGKNKWDLLRASTARG